MKIKNEVVSGETCFTLFEVFFLFKSISNKAPHYAAVKQQRLVSALPMFGEGQQKVPPHFVLDLGERVLQHTPCFWKCQPQSGTSRCCSHFIAQGESHGHIQLQVQWKCNGRAEETWNAWERPHILYWIWKCRTIWMSKCLWYVINKECFKDGKRRIDYQNIILHTI